MVAFNPFTASGQIDPFCWTDARNFGAGSARRPHTRYRSYAGDEIEWQESVYDLALEEWEATPFEVVIDLGCGAGDKSLNRFGDHAGLIQVDRTDYRADTAKAAGIAFRKVSFDSWDDLDALRESLDLTKRTLIICADVIEHLFDPRPLIAFIRGVLLSADGNAAILSTPDHERIDGGRAGELPMNAEHVRQWSIFSFGAQLRSAGFTVERYGVVPMHRFDTLGCTICAKLTCSPDDYAAFLARAGLPEPATRLLVTGEHKSLGRGGGIGTYAYQSDSVLEDASIFLLFGGNAVRSDGQSLKDLRQFVHVADITRQPGVPVVCDAGPRTAQDLLDAAETLFFFYPELRYVEYDDYLGYAHAIVQAKESGVLPTRLKTVCYCHGNHHYLEVNHSKFFFGHAFHQQERVCAERSDVTLIPSDYLSGLYHRAGFKLKQELRLAYPFEFDYGEISETDYKKIRRILFFGKRTRGKGYHLFGQAVNALAENGDLDDVEEIVVAGVGDEDFEFAPSVAKKIRYHLYPNDQLTEMLYAERIDTLAVVPYLGDNFPYSVHELIDTGIHTIFARAGGLPEVLGDSDAENMALFDPKPDALAECIRQKLAQSGLVRGGEVKMLRYNFRTLQEARNKAYLAFCEEARKGAPLSHPGSGSWPAYDVVITYHNEDARYLDDALSGLASQSIRPDQIVVVNDASQPERLQAAQDVVARYENLNVRIVTPERNLGLADARNFGMAHTSAEFLIAHDVDNMLRADAAEKMLATLVANDDVAAATCYSLMFPDHENWVNRVETERQFGFFQPIGPDLGEFEVSTFGDALAMYRRSMLDETGGWRNSGKEPLEDFELFYTLVASGLYVAVIPAPIAMYRVREDSMLRTYDRFAGYRRVADVITRRLGRDGLSIVRRVMELQEREAQLSQPVVDAPQGIEPQSQTNEPIQAVEQPISEHQTYRLMRATMPARLRDEQSLLDHAILGASWKTVAWRHPTRVRHWQAIRRLQRAAKRMGLRE